MDTETSGAIETLRADIRAMATSLHSEIGQLRVEMSGMDAYLRADMSDMRGELKRHTEVLVESLRDDIRIVAEGVVALGAKVQSLDTKVESLDTKVESLLKEGMTFARFRSCWGTATSARR